MAIENALPRTFLHRSDLLAVAIGCNVQELPDHLGIGRRTLFAARKSDDEVSGKTWAKLEAAEKEARLLDGEKPRGAEDVGVADLSKGGLGRLESRIQSMEEQLGEILPLLREVRALLEDGAVGQTTGHVY